MMVQYLSDVHAIMGGKNGYRVDGKKNTDGMWLDSTGAAVQFPDSGDFSLSEDSGDTLLADFEKLETKGNSDMADEEMYLCQSCVERESERFLLAKWVATHS